ncbi:39S ribosomal protein L20-like protein [Dinothrombium tinctorium]|uniref:Large ribosomal subunit protein bL20m n=1 Tax=Dinothrombium tinctorium TaxID=1965070 RepID=A0A3S3S4Z9_9ACAR|nr:39S ribosomal protein L20-like protein [Dinothrombium tinctorium]RWS09211.1 39S ribosomal protein L20-like protein [Dinothrombium tinctorium]RWS09232.1 39S ribosomal protein L20-like protein [Dinothrombium tinctorium]
MVQLTQVLCKYMPKWVPRFRGSNKSFMRKQHLLSLCGHLYGRKRNCFRIARRALYRTFEISQDKRREKKVFFRDLFTQRINSACAEHDLQYKYFITILPQLNVELDRKILSSLAIWEPRTFKSLVELVKAKRCEEGIDEAARNATPPAGVITRGML